MADLEQDAWDELAKLVSDLGNAGGAIGPSVYDTAQRTRLLPEPDDRAGTIPWLLAQQRVDGGWGEPEIPRFRDVPTLAAVLALRIRAPSRARAAIREGLAFLEQRGPLWSPLDDIDSLPVGAELLLPTLVREAARVGLELRANPYREVETLGERKLRRLASLVPDSTHPAAYSFEGLGLEPSAAWLNPVAGCVGTSPAATAAWLHGNGGHEPPAQAGRVAAYLDRASRATGAGIPGVVPTAFPIDNQERIWGLFCVGAAGLADHPAVAKVTSQKAQELARALGPNGIGNTEFLAPDGDCTSTAVAALRACDIAADASLIRRFEQGGCIVSYPGELNSSVSATAHGAIGLRLSGEDDSAQRRWLRERQGADGRWTDKWHASWLYATSHAMLALEPRQDGAALARAADAILRAQHADGGWGMGVRSTGPETSYAVMGLLRQVTHAGSPALWSALQRSRAILARSLERSTALPRWTAKEPYSPRRIDRIGELVAFLAVERTAGVEQGAQAQPH